MKNLYDVLGLSSAATPAEIKKAYFEHAKKYHPDSGNAEEVRKFYEICEAYEILSDPEKRTAYDATTIGNKIESNLVRDARQPIYRTPEDKLSHPQPVLDESRRRQIFRFRRELLTKAVLRVAGWSLFVGFAAYIYGFILAGPPYLSFICGFFLGLTWALYENFNVNSFMPSLRAQKIATGIRYFIIVICIGYLASLLL